MENEKITTELANALKILDEKKVMLLTTPFGNKRRSNGLFDDEVYIEIAQQIMIRDIDSVKVLIELSKRDDVCSSLDVLSHAINVLNVAGKFNPNKYLPFFIKLKYIGNLLSFDSCREIAEKIIKEEMFKEMNKILEDANSTNYTSFEHLDGTMLNTKSKTNIVNDNFGDLSDFPELQNVVDNYRKKITSISSAKLLKAFTILGPSNRLINMQPRNEYVFGLLITQDGNLSMETCYKLTDYCLEHLPIICHEIINDSEKVYNAMENGIFEKLKTSIDYISIHGSEFGVYVELCNPMLEVINAIKDSQIADAIVAKYILWNNPELVQKYIDVVPKIKKLKGLQDKANTLKQELRMETPEEQIIKEEQSNPMYIGKQLFDVLKNGLVSKKISVFANGGKDSKVKISDIVREIMGNEYDLEISSEFYKAESFDYIPRGTIIFRTKSYVICKTNESLMQAKDIKSIYCIIDKLR